MLSLQLRIYCRMKAKRGAYFRRALMVENFRAVYKSFNMRVCNKIKILRNAHEPFTLNNVSETFTAIGRLRFRLQRDIKFKGKESDRKEIKTN